VTATQPAADVGLRVQTWFSPDQDCQSALVAFVGGTREHLRVAMYGFHLPPVRDQLIALRARGADVALVLDHSQAEGRAERADVEALRAAGVPLVVGTSQRHRIMHHKFFVRDRADVLAGSYNASLTAALEANYFDVTRSSERAALFLAKWQALWDWIRANEPQDQEVKP
jgi:phosphatidylserine/phosphatidylglycerophosphate/cardiolipin synthase-like enzyme